MKLQYQGSSSSLYASRTWRHKSDVLTNSGGRALIKPLWCKDRSEYTQSTQTFKHTGWISATGAGPRVCIRHPDWALMISESWKASGSLTQRRYCASGSGGRWRKSFVIDCGRAASNFPPHVQSQTHQAAEQRQGFINGLQRDVRRLLVWLVIKHIGQLVECMAGFSLPSFWAPTIIYYQN